MLGEVPVIRAEGTTVKPPTRIVALLGGTVLAISLAGCAANTAAAPAVTTAVPMATATASTTTEAEPTDGPASAVPAAHNDADVTFAQMMTIHHEGALEMAELAVEQAGSDEVKDLAATIEAAQLPEIELMESWLTAWGEPMEASGHAGMDHGGMDMDGMSQEQVMAELQQTSGADFDKQFLTAMIAHHEGAVMMAEEELGDGENSEALELAHLIIDSQQTEIQQMQEYLKNL